MAVSSISAQSSLGMGAVINATFGSIIEIILYSVALTQGKGLITEGALIGSFLAGLLLMPGLSMMSGAIKKKEQRFNAKSAGTPNSCCCCYCFRRRSRSWRHVLTLACNIFLFPT